MAQRRHNPAAAPTLATAIVYTTALLAGAALIGSGQTSTSEALGYVVPLLVLYERLPHRSWSLWPRCGCEALSHFRDRARFFDAERRGTQMSTVGA